MVRLSGKKIVTKNMNIFLRFGTNLKNEKDERL